MDALSPPSSPGTYGHVPEPRQLPPQQVELAEHTAPDGRQQVPAPPSVTEQVRPAVPGQQSAGEPHAPPWFEQQVSVTVLQLLEQQSCPTSHRSPTSAQPHVPASAPPGMLQAPLQQSAAEVHEKNCRVQQEP